jgi:TRAP-type C4-dicarboxylate transport system permease small subunit
VQAFRARVDRWLENTVAVLLGAMVLNVSWQVFTRFVLREPSTYTEELARFLLIWSGLLGACVAWRRRMHLSIRLFGDTTGDPPRWMARVTLISTAAFSVLVLFVGGIRLVALTLQLEQHSAALGWPLGYVYLAVPLTGAILLFYVLVELFPGVEEP